MKLLHKGLLIICLVLLCGLLLPWNAAAAGVTDSGTCGDDLTWTLDSEGTLTISGTGAMEDYDMFNNNTASWYEYRESIESVVIENGVTTIGDDAFYNCSLTKITIPDSVIAIGDSAFRGCYILTEVTIPNSVTTIEDSAFSGCYSLTEVTIPDSVTTIEDSAFITCSSLNGIWVEDGNPAYCSDARGVLFNKDMSTLIQAPGAISDSYTIPNSVTIIGNQAFWNCVSLTSVTIPDSVTTIGNGVFFWCDSLSKIVFRGDAPSIGYDAFRYVTATAYYPEGNDTWTEDEMQNYGGDITWVSYEKENEPGDLTGDGVVDNRDVAYLLWYTLFPEDYPITGDADFNGDGTVDNQDVAYLLWHTLFPEDYPL